jgi:hypothetical protein
MPRHLSYEPEVMAVPQRGAPSWSIRRAANLDANDQTAKKFVAELSEQQLDWRPAPCSWWSSLPAQRNFVGLPAAPERLS